MCGRCRLIGMAADCLILRPHSDTVMARVAVHLYFLFSVHNTVNNSHIGYN